MAIEDNTKLTVTVSRETDMALRAYLGAQGMRKGDLSKFIEEAIRWRMFDRNVQTVKERSAHIAPDALQAVIDEACASVRGEMWPAPANALK